MIFATFVRLLSSAKVIPAYVLVAAALHVSSVMARDHPCSGGSLPAPPKSDVPTPEDRKRLGGCNSESLYYGLGMPANPKDARICAFIEAEQGGDGLPLQGNGILVMIYANGAAAKRNTPLSSRYACALGWDANATDALMLRIEQAADSGTPLDTCDVVPAGTGLDLRAVHNQAMRLERIDGDERAIVSRWPDSRRDAFLRLKRAAIAYESARAATEISTRDSQSLQMSKRCDFRSEFTALMRAIDSPAGASSDLNQRDLELNATYRELLKVLVDAQAADTGPSGSLTPASLRNAELVWLRYVDAWESFRSTAGASFSATALRSMLTVQRTNALRRLLIEQREG